jgi:hypothetical protein
VKKANYSTSPGFFPTPNGSVGQEILSSGLGEMGAGFEEANGEPCPLGTLWLEAATLAQKGF